MQVVEQGAKVPFEIVQPSGAAMTESHPPSFAAKITKETRATRSMMWLWTGESTADSEGYRVIGTGQKGTLQIPSHIAVTYPAVMGLRLYGMNANGKVYSVDKTYQLNK